MIWGDQQEAAAILKEMRELGMKQRVFGSFRTIGAGLLDSAGPAAEGLEAVYPFDPTRDDPQWLTFKDRFRTRFGKEPEVFASLAYDTMNILLQSMCKAGLNRGKIRDALAGLEQYKGVTGAMAFDPNSKNFVPLYLATVHNGKITYRRYPMQKQYARLARTELSTTAQRSPMRPAARCASFCSVRARTRPRRNSRVCWPPIRGATKWSRSRRMFRGARPSQLVEQLYQDGAIGMISTDRNASHLAEQLAIKAFVPLIAISSDKSLTAVNIPWIFRMPVETRIQEALRSMIEAAEKSGRTAAVCAKRLRPASSIPAASCERALWRERHSRATAG